MYVVPPQLLVPDGTLQFATVSYWRSVHLKSTDGCRQQLPSAMTNGGVRGAVILCQRPRQSSDGQRRRLVGRGCVREEPLDFKGGDWCRGRALGNIKADPSPQNHATSSRHQRPTDPHLLNQSETVTCCEPIDRHAKENCNHLLLHVRRPSPRAVAFFGLTAGQVRAHQEDGRCRG